MKATLTFILVIAIQTSLCFGSTEAPTQNYSIKTAQTDIEFTAFKMTAKLGVKGWFKKIHILSGGEGTSIKEAIHQCQFSIPVHSLFTNDEGRDYKIKTFFFGKMEDTAFLSGQLFLEDDSLGYAIIKMNNISNKLPFTYKVTNKTFNLKADMNIDRWFVQEALSSLNFVCKDLHKGPDGISRTWPDVDLNITVDFK